MGQNLGQIRPNVVKKVKKWALSIGFFSYFAWEIPFKAKVVVVQTHEWKFKANIARNNAFEVCLGPSFSLIWIKNGKN